MHTRDDKYQVLRTVKARPVGTTEGCYHLLSIHIKPDNDLGMRFYKHNIMSRTVLFGIKTNAMHKAQMEEQQIKCDTDTKQKPIQCVPSGRSSNSIPHSSACPAPFHEFETTHCALKFFLVLYNSSSL